MSQDFDTTHNISPGAHLYQFYKTTENYLRIMNAYFQAGLEKGEACLWLVPRRIGLEEAHSIAEKQIQHFLYYLCCGQIQIICGEDWFLSGGRFDEELALSNASRYVANILKQGYHRLRAAGSAESIPREDWEKLGSYESRVHEVIKGAPIIALCAYPIQDCSLKETKMVVDCHDDVLISRF